MNIAVVSGDPTSLDVLSYAAERRSHQAITVDKPERLLAKLPFEPSGIIVEFDDGNDRDLAAVQSLRTRFPSAALLLTVDRPREPFPSRAVKAGADEVIRRPYNPTEVVLRLEARAARAATAPVADSIKVGDLEVALDRYHASKNGTPLPLTKLELRLLYCLCEHQPHLTPIERLLTFGWDTLGDPDASLLKTHISHLRHKLRDAGGDDFEIVSRQTLGYVMRPLSVDGAPA